MVISVFLSWPIQTLKTHAEIPERVERANAQQIAPVPNEVMRRTLTTCLAYREDHGQARKNGINLEVVEKVSI